jgi:hypothetical protein
MNKNRCLQFPLIFGLIQNPSYFIDMSPISETYYTIRLAIIDEIIKNIQRKMSESISSSYEMDEDRSSPLHPSDAQEQALAILPIPSALLSIFGSSIIIYIAVLSRKQRKWTPYTRLLFVMSVFDIILSVNLSVATFLRPRERSPRLWSFGNDATCSVVGFLNQFSGTSIFYNGMLSFYFLLTARYDFSNEYIAAKLECWAHFLSVGFSVTCACVGAGLGLYGEMTSGMGCWVSRPPECDEEWCISRTMGWISYGLPALIVLICLVINNTIILLYVRQQTRPFRRIQTISNGRVARFREYSSSSSKEDNSFSESDAIMMEMDHESPSKRQDVLGGVQCLPQVTVSEDTVDRKLFVHRNDQARRLRLVSSQAFLYVAAYLLCNVWTGVVGIMESGRETTEEEMEMLVRFYTVFVLQSVLTPLSGLFNMLVFIRPKYMKWRHEYPNETRIWAVRRAIFGSDVMPARSPHHQPTRPQAVAHEDTKEDIDTGEAINLPAVTRLPPDLMSSLTASQGDVDHVVDANNDGRWTAGIPQESSVSLPVLTPRFRSSAELRSSVLDVISEMEEPIVSKEESVLDNTPILLPEEVRASEAARRWSSNTHSSSGDGGLLANLSLVMPLREECTHGSEETLSRMGHATAPSKQLSSTDMAIAMPQRRMSPPPAGTAQSAWHRC